MTHDPQTGPDLTEGLLRAARDVPDAPPDFMARVLHDALAAQPAPRGLPVRGVPVAPRASLWQRMVAGVGGGMGLAGLGTAVVAGVMIGYVQPEALLSLGAPFGMTAEAAVLDLSPAFDTLLTEESAP